MAESTQTARVVRLLPGGQVAIPEQYRQQLGLGEGALLRVSVADGELRIRPLPAGQAAAGSPWLRELYEYFAPVRAEAIEKGYTEEEINADIDAAIAEVRAERD